jgi:DNA repair exonuclease SbcCD nuclease subunit
MSRVLIVSDLHFGIPQKLNDILWAVKTAREYAAKNNIEKVFVLGDVFHDRVQYNIEVMNAAYQFFDETRKMGQEWVAFPGNHDMPLRNSWHINALKPLDKVLTVVNEIKLAKVYDQRFWIVPFIHYESIYMKVLRKIEEQYEDGDVLLTHVGVNNATLNECFLIKNWSVVDFTDSKFDRVFTGHFHCHQNVGKNVWYPGSPIPFRFDEGMVPHGFIDFNTVTKEVTFVEIFDLNLVEGKRPPDYVTITDDMVEEYKCFAGDNVRVQLNRDYSKDELMRMRESLQDRGALNIKLNKVVEEHIDLEEERSSALSLKSPSELFERWVAYDNPKKLDVDLLKKLNDEIISETLSL